MKKKKEEADDNSLSCRCIVQVLRQLFFATKTIQGRTIFFVSFPSFPGPWNERGRIHLKKKPKWVFAPSLLFFFLVGAAVAVAVFIHTHTVYLYMSLDYQRCAWEKLPPRQLLLVGRRGCCNTAEFSDGRVRCCTHGKTFSFPSFSSDDHVKCCFCLD